MNKKTKKIIVGIIAVVVIVVLVVAFGWQGKEGETRVVKIGYIAPFSGPAASYGEYVLKSFKLGIEDFNKDSNLNFKVVYEDGVCDPREATTGMNKLINIDKVRYIIGGFCSGETLAIAPIAEENKIILFSPGSGSPDITNAGDYIFRNLVSDDYTAKTIAKIAIENNDKKIVMITENTDYPQTLKKAFIDYYTNNGGEIILDETFSANDLDFRTIIAKAKEKKIDVVYIVVQSYKNAGPLLRQMRELDYSPKIYTSESVISAEALDFYDQGYKDVLEGAIFTQPRFDETNSKTSTLLAKYKDRYGTTEGPIPPIYLATYYDSVFLLGEAINKAGDSPEQVKEYFYKVKNWKGAVGIFSFDKNGDAVTDVEAKIISNGKIIPLSK